MEYRIQSAVLFAVLLLAGPAGLRAQPSSAAANPIVQEMNAYFGPLTTTFPWSSAFFGGGSNSAVRPIPSAAAANAAPQLVMNWLSAPRNQLATSTHTAFLPVYNYFCEVKHNRCFVSGNVADGQIYHQAPEERLNAQWQFVPAESGYYYIYDRKHGKALVASDNGDGMVYHQDPAGRPNAQWKLEPGQVAGTWFIVDRKWNKYLVSGDIADGRVYHQPHNNRANAQWILAAQQAPVMQLIGQ